MAQEKIGDADAKLAFELGIHAGNQAIESLKIALRVVPPELMTHATAIALAFIGHDTTVLMGSMMTALGPERATAFAKMVEELEEYFDEKYLEFLQETEKQRGQPN